MKQISAFIENKTGRLAEVTGILAEKGINIHALSIADTTDFGILRFIVSEPDKTKEVLKNEGILVKTTDVIAVALDHTPGSLSRVLRELEKFSISIEYMYAFTSRSTEHDAILILRLNKQEESANMLKDCNIEILDEDFLKKLN